MAYPQGFEPHLDVLETPVLPLTLEVYIGLKDGNRTHNNWSHNPAPLPVGLPPTKNGVPTGIRTQAPLIKSQVLYLLSYRHIYYTSKFMTLRSITLLQNFVFVNNTQCQWRDSNPFNTMTGISMELQSRIELPTSSLPMRCSTTELPKHMAEGAGFEPAGLAPQ